ncbi:SDR family oxidoreductase [Actinoalloteichus spitiensis]|uniref:SDR family oxidoreductase n=1 Tax=Actinoalloteichus spitiensis TaxID=252394 RepID=UPI00035E15F7|nr:SDR family oxidoreductase [Actinoalloteichus spitiensis]
MDRNVTVITGGSRGIGAATARLLGSEGHHVVVGYRYDRDAADRVVADVTSAGGRATACAVDIADEDAVDRLFEVAAERCGPVTGLVNNAAVTSRLGPLAETSTLDIRSVVEVGVVGYLLCARRAVRAMSTARGGGGGTIVNVSSAAATLGSPGEYVHYAASKAAVDAMTVGLAKEVAAEGIRVNAVAPGTVHTGIHASSGDPDRATRVAQRIPLGRAGQPEEIAHAIRWFLSPGASYATGAVLRVAGGI